MTEDRSEDPGDQEAQLHKHYNLLHHSLVPSSNHVPDLSPEQTRKHCCGNICDSRCDPRSKNAS
jgi:hypothetical protein